MAGQRASGQTPVQTDFPGEIVPIQSAPGTIVDNSGLIPFDQSYFAFEVENVLGSLKEVPIWDELEKMLDNPYQIALAPELGVNPQGFPSYVSTQARRRSFVYRDAAGQPCPPGTPGCNEVPLPPFVVHPLNYNHMSGEELRLLNIDFEGAPWEIPDQLFGPFVDPNGGPNAYVWSYRPIEVSPGEDRIDEEEAAIDFNSPIKPDATFTLLSTEPIPEEGALVTGGDPGEPGYAGFGFLRGPRTRVEQYSTPALPLIDVSASQRNPGQNIVPGLGTGTRRLFDPVRGFINPRNPSTGAGGLNKPSLRVPPLGNPSNPGYARNSAAILGVAPQNLHPSNENDYYRRPNDGLLSGIPAGREAAAVLGKALFWDMQVGSDGVQSCGTCHFHAGVDNRTKNQLNPNHLGGDLTFQLHQPNEELVSGDFPFHKTIDPKIVAESADTPTTTTQLFDGSTVTVADGGNFVSDVNDVASSMGVIFHNFLDIPPIGSFTAPSAGVRSLLPDLGELAADPIPGFNGANGLAAIRRVEPRNTPTFFGVTMNFDNFWDGRARHDFNGGSVQGPSDPQAHVFVHQGGRLVATRQVIRFASLGSLATGPALSEFEMSWLGRNWPKIGKKLLQNGVVPLANQLVDPLDSVLGPYSNQPGNPAPRGTPAQLAQRAAGKPGLCVSYRDLIRASFYPSLWNNTSQHLNGGYTDGRLPAGTPRAIPVLQDTDGDGDGETLDETNTDDPFDHYVLTIANGSVLPANRNQFSQMEANFSLFWGLSLHAWVTMLVPDDTPFDRFYDKNNDAYLSFGEANEKFLVLDLLPRGTVDPLTGVAAGDPDPVTGAPTPSFTEVGNFKRDPDVFATVGVTVEDGSDGVAVPAGGTRSPGDPDPLFGMDLFLGSNLSLKNPNYRTFRCGECHAGATLTDHTFELSHQVTFNDFVPEFGEPGQPVFPEPLGRQRVITGFSLEGELNGNAQDGIERNIGNFALTELGEPRSQGLFDNGIYNIGVTPIANDLGRGGNDGFGWPLSLSALALKNIGGLDYTPGAHLSADAFSFDFGLDGHGLALPTFDPTIDRTSGGIFEETAQDQQINPGFEEEPADPQLPPYLGPWASNVNVGDETQQDELFIGLNTLCEEPILEGFVDTFGPINPAATVGESYNMARQAEMATWPVVNKANRMGSFKAPSLRNVEMTGPYFHNGGNLTLRQQLDFYLRGGNFPFANATHRDFLIANLNIEDEALGGVDPITGAPAFTDAEKEHAKESLIDFLLELTDERVAFERAPFDHPEVFVPLDGAAPENTFGRNGFLANIANGKFEHVPAVGQGGIANKLSNFLGVVSHHTTAQEKADGVVSHYDH
jgi:cytochrome c peroxidase